VREKLRGIYPNQICKSQFPDAIDAVALTNDTRDGLTESRKRGHALQCPERAL
jgi:hypothetical protein